MQGHRAGAVAAAVALLLAAKGAVVVRKAEEALVELAEVTEEEGFGSAAGTAAATAS